MTDQQMLNLQLNKSNSEISLQRVHHVQWSFNCLKHINTVFFSYWKDAEQLFADIWLLAEVQDTLHLVLHCLPLPWVFYSHSWSTPTPLHAAHFSLKISPLGLQHLATRSLCQPRKTRYHLNHGRDKSSTWNELSTGNIKSIRCSVM